MEQADGTNQDNTHPCITHSIATSAYSAYSVNNESMNVITEYSGTTEKVSLPRLFDSLSNAPVECDGTTRKSADV